MKKFILTGILIVSLAALCGCGSASSTTHPIINSRLKELNNHASKESVGIQKIIDALADKGQPDKYLIAMKYLETMKTITSGKDNKVVYMPYEATGILSSIDGIKQMLTKN